MDGAEAAAPSPSPAPPPSAPPPSAPLAEAWATLSRRASRGWRGWTRAVTDPLPAGTSATQAAIALGNARMTDEQLREARAEAQRVDAERRLRKEQRERRLGEAAAVWETEILPRWPARRDDKRTMQLGRAGVPPRVRGRVWAAAVGDALGITDELFRLCLARADAPAPAHAAGKAGTAALIAQDVGRTFPDLCFFQPLGPLHAPLDEVLRAYVGYRPDVGYVQGMSFVAAMLLLYAEPAAAFRLLCNLLARPCHRAFFTMDTDRISRYQTILHTLLHEHVPAVATHLGRLGVGTDLFLYDWMLTLFAHPLPLDVAARIWDTYLLGGDMYLFRAAVAVMRLLEPRLVGQPFEVVAYDLTHLPQTWDADTFATAADSIDLTEARFAALLEAAGLP